jgi:hypothetical protein
MDDKERQAAFMSALITEHFVLQAAASATVSEAAARASLYVFSLSSSLVAMGFALQSPEVFLPFAATLLPAVFVLGIFTFVRLVDTGVEDQQFLAGIARIRSYYRTLTPEAVVYFSTESGRWPESPASPGHRFGPRVALFTTAASMIAFINSFVAGAGVTLLASNLLARHQIVFALLLGIATALVIMAALLAFQGWKYRLAAPAEVRAMHLEAKRRTK